jgi:hypothetical protein
MFSGLGLSLFSGFDFCELLCHCRVICGLSFYYLPGFHNVGFCFEV